MSIVLPEPFVAEPASLDDLAQRAQRNFETITLEWATTPAVLGFQNFAYSNGWRSFNGGADVNWGTAGYYKDPIGFVHLRGLLDKNGGNFVGAEVMFTLPVGYRPIQRAMFSPRVAGGATIGNGRCDLAANGQFTMIDGAAANPVVFVALDGMSFVAEG